MLEDQFVECSFPNVSANDAAVLVVECADITLELSDDWVVRGVHCPSGLASEQFEPWAGQALKEIVSSDSLPKLPLLFGDNSARADSERRWRHLNLTTDTGAVVPFLLKYFMFEGVIGPVHVVCGRDLRPIVDMQNQLQNELIALQGKQEELERLLAKSPKQ